MAKLKSPLLSIKAWGQLSKDFVLRRHGKDTIAEKKPLPVDQNTAPQIYQRTNFQNAIDEWKQLTQAQKATWEKYGTEHHMTGYAWYMRAWLLNPAPRTFLQLEDTPDSYQDKAGNLPAVNEAENALGFVDLTDLYYTKTLHDLITDTPHVSDLEKSYWSSKPDEFTELADVPGSYEDQALKLVRVAAEEDSLEFTSPYTPIPEGRAATPTTVYQSIPGIEPISVSTYDIDADKLYHEPIYVATEITIDQLIIVVSGSANEASARLGIYTADKDWQPIALVLDAGEVSVATTGIKIISINKTLSPGRYLLVLVSNGAPNLRTIKGGNRYVGVELAGGATPLITMLYRAFVYAALPSPPSDWTNRYYHNTPFYHMVSVRVSTP